MASDFQWPCILCVLMEPSFQEPSLLCLFGVLRRFQHCTGHITTGSWKGRGNQYIEFARVVYCKLPTNGKQLPAFPLKAVTGIEPPTSEVGGESVTTLPPWPPKSQVCSTSSKTMEPIIFGVQAHSSNGFCKHIMYFKSS